MVKEITVATSTPDGARYTDVYGILRDEVIVDRLRRDFEKIWDGLPKFQKDAANTARCIEELRNIIIQSVG